MIQELMDRAWHLACEAEGFEDEVPDWAIQRVSDRQYEIYTELETEL
jgi:hypothetical protein